MSYYGIRKSFFKFVVVVVWKMRSTNFLEDFTINMLSAYTVGGGVSNCTMYDGAPWRKLRRVAVSTVDEKCQQCLTDYIG